MNIERKKLSDLNPSAYNPRKTLQPGDADFERLENSIKTFGNVEPIVWNSQTGNIIGGHQRYAVLKHMGETKTDVVVVNMPIDEERLLNIALNKIKGKWDYDKLSPLLASFDPVDAKMSGFSAQEIMLLVANANDQVSETLGSADFVFPSSDSGDNDFSDYEGLSRDKDVDNDYMGYPDVKTDEDRDSVFLGDETIGAKGFIDEENLGGDRSDTVFKNVDVPVDDGLSWVIAVRFFASESANKWMREHGINKTIKPEWKCITVRMDEEGEV